MFMVLTNELNNTLNKVNDNNYATRGLSLSSITELENIKLLTFKVTLANFNIHQKYINNPS